MFVFKKHKSVLCFATCILSLAGCSTINTGNDVFDAIYSTTSGVMKEKGNAKKCQQGHAQDRINCRKAKQEQVEKITGAINKQKKN